MIEALFETLLTGREKPPVLIERHEKPAAAAAIRRLLQLLGGLFRLQGFQDGAEFSYEKLGQGLVAFAAPVPLFIYVIPGTEDLAVPLQVGIDGPGAAQRSKITVLAEIAPETIRLLLIEVEVGKAGLGFVELGGGRIRHGGRRPGLWTRLWRLGLAVVIN